jgi:hypothetical protein
MHTASSAASTDLVRRLADAWNARNLDDFIGLLAPDVEWYDPAMPEPPVRGRVSATHLHALQPPGHAEGQTRDRRSAHAGAREEEEGQNPGRSMKEAAQRRSR